MSGLQNIPLRVPEEWSAAWFERFVRETLSLADVRNAIEGTGISISGTSDENATISASEDVEALTQATLLTLTPSALTNAFRVVPQDGILLSPASPDVLLELADNGIPAVKLQAIPLAKFGPITELSVLGAPVAAGGVNAVEAIASSSNDTLLRRAADVLEWGQLTAGMFPAAVIPDAALSANVALYDADVASFTTGQFADARISESSVTQHEAALAIGFDQLTGVPQIPGGLQEFADDAAATTGGIAVNGLYRTGSVVKIRVS